MVGRFVGWFMKFPALPNWVSIFCSSTGSSCTTFLTLQEWIFPVAWCLIWGCCPLPVYKQSYTWLSISSHIYQVVYFQSKLCLWLESQVKGYLLPSVHFWTYYHPMFSQLQLVPDGAFPNSGVQNLGHQESIEWVLTFGVKAYWGLSHRWGRRVFHLSWSLELCHNLWVLWLRYWSQFFRLFSHSFFKAGFRYL